MQKLSLPNSLQLSLQEHVNNADIVMDDDLREVLTKLSALHEKIEALKLHAQFRKGSNKAPF